MELEYSDDDDMEETDSAESYAQIRALLNHALVMENHGELGKAENLYDKALLLDPTDLRTLNSFAVFLHRKRGNVLLNA